MSATQANAAATLPKLEAALHAAGRGFRVFPVVPDAKIPAIEGWQGAATTDADTIRSWWGANERYNIGIATGDILAIDVDVKKGAPGAGSLDLLDMMGLPESYRVRTPSGGTHVYLRSTGHYRNRAKTLLGFPGVDIRAQGGFVVGSGSTLDGAAYEEAVPGDLADLPDWFHEILSAQDTAHVKNAAAPLIELDRAESIERARHYLLTRAPEAVEGAGGDHSTYIVAAELRSMGVSQGTALELMLEHWNESKASPPWLPDDLAVKVANAFEYGQGAPGWKTAAGEFETLDIEVGEPPDIAARIAKHVEDLKSASAVRDRSRFRMLTISESIALVGVNGADPLVDGLLDQGTLAIVYGKPNCGKSFVALDLAGCIATGRPWNGRDTAAGLVVYLAAEGGAGIHKRVQALVTEKRIPDEAPFMLAPCSVDLFATDVDLRAILEDVKKLVSRHGPLRLVVIDTLARVFGGDENSGRDMGQLLRNLDRLREATGATVLVIHHTGKDASKGSRGHSSLLGAVDTEIEIVDRMIRTTKQRDHEPLDPEIRFSLQTVDLGFDRRGRTMTSCVVRYPSADEFGPMPLDRAAERFAQSLVIAFAAADGTDVSWADWQAEHCRSIDPKWRAGDEPPPGCTLGNLRRLRKEIVESGRAKCVGNDTFEPISANGA